jgi:cytochrome c-type biogenesis protein CcmH/NrfG
LQAALQQEPDNSQFLNMLGFAWMQMGQLRQAQEAFEAAVRANPRDAQAAQNLAIVKQMAATRSSTTQTRP